MPYDGLVVTSKNGPRWTGEVRLVSNQLDAPFRWREPRRVFVNSMSDLFHEKLSDTDIAAVFGVMASAPRHAFQVLTKRPKRMLEWFDWVQPNAVDVCTGHANEALISAGHAIWSNARGSLFGSAEWPLPNVWLGVSCEDQETANERLPLLMRTPAAVRFVSCEPLLGPIDLDDWLYEPSHCRACGHYKAWYDTNPNGLPTIHTCLMGVQITGEPGAPRCMACNSLEIDELNGLNWVIVGGESGPCARPMEEEWARAIKDQCLSASVPLFYKQKLDGRGRKVSLPMLDGRQWDGFPGGEAP